MAVELGDNIQQEIARILAAQGGVYGLDIWKWWRDTAVLSCRHARIFVGERRRSELAPAAQPKIHLTLIGTSSSHVDYLIGQDIIIA